MLPRVPVAPPVEILMLPEFPAPAWPVDTLTSPVDPPGALPELSCDHPVLPVPLQSPDPMPARPVLPVPDVPPDDSQMPTLSVSVASNVHNATKSGSLNRIFGASKM